jgi:hypothetical protein
MATTYNMVADRYEIKMSSTLEEFLNALGIDLCEERCSEIYAQMLVCRLPGTDLYGSADEGPQWEVERGRLSLVYARSSLLPHLRNDKSVQAPFYRTQIDYVAFLHESKNIYAKASPSTREFYNAAEKGPNIGHANCAIKWLLWQALRQAECCNSGISAQYGIETMFGESPRPSAIRTSRGKHINASHP